MHKLLLGLIVTLKSRLFGKNRGQNISPGNELKNIENCFANYEPR